MSKSKIRDDIKKMIVDSSQYCDPHKSNACACRVEALKDVEDPCDHCIYYHGPLCLCPGSG